MSATHGDPQPQTFFFDMLYFLGALAGEARGLSYPEFCEAVGRLAMAFPACLASPNHLNAPDTGF